MAIHYIDNTKFYEALVDYKKQCLANPEVTPQVPEYVGSCIIQIAEGLAKRPNFSGYSWRDEMIGDAIETCLKYVKSFDPDKSKSPFGYFTTTCWYSFINRITLEKKQSKIKRAMIMNAGFDTFSLQGHDEDGEFTMHLVEFMNSLGDDEKVEKFAKEQLPGALEDFME